MTTKQETAVVEQDLCSIIDAMPIVEVYKKCRDEYGTKFDHPDTWRDDDIPELESDLRDELFGYMLAESTVEHTPGPCEACAKDGSPNMMMTLCWLTYCCDNHHQDEYHATDFPIYASAPTLKKQRDELFQTLVEIMHTGTDCSPADNPESFYHSQLSRTIGIAARAISKCTPTEASP